MKYRIVQDSNGRYLVQYKKWYRLKWVSDKVDISLYCLYQKKNWIKSEKLAIERVRKLRAIHSYNPVAKVVYEDSDFTNNHID